MIICYNICIMEFEVVIGLEVHVHMDTNTKMFCGCEIEYDAPPNTHTCPVCLALPGSLPVVNKKAIEYGVRTALALNCHINLTSIFARKNYFYPDLPKGYQISQYEKPLAEHGFVLLENKRVRIRRLHLEEDAGKNNHFESESLVDLNRAGTPLMEIVTEPDLNSSEEAKEFLEKLRAIVRYAGVSKADMEKGQMRCDVNVSLKPKGSSILGTRVEIKNVNSFKFVQKAIEYEIERQSSLLLEGKTIDQETRGFDPQSGKTFVMRTKEEAEDYRYFPDPDLLPLVLTENFVNNIKNTMPELPDERIERYMKDYNLSKYEATVLTNLKEFGDFFQEATQYTNEYKSLANWLLNDVLGFLNENQIKDIPISPKQLSELVELIKSNVISTKIAKEVIKDMLITNKDPHIIIKEKGLQQISNEEEIKSVVIGVLEKYPNERQRLKNGEEKLIGFLVGEVMKLTKGKANPKLVNQFIRECL